MSRLLAGLVLVLVGCSGGDVTVAPGTTRPTVETTVTTVSPTTRPASTLPPTTLPPTTLPPTTLPPTTLPPTTLPPTTKPASSTPPTTSPPPPTLFHDGSPMIRFSVEVGAGIDLSRDELALTVVDILGDERSWTGRGVGVELVDDGGDVTLIVASPDEVDRMCAPLQTNGRYSCARNGWIAINSLRWFGATDDWPADLETYRRYLINHEVGHYVVGPGHDGCPGPGEPAPIMMQQTKGLDGCEANGWVDP